MRYEDEAYLMRADTFPTYELKEMVLELIPEYPLTNTESDQELINLILTIKRRRQDNEK